MANKYQIGQPVVIKDGNQIQEVRTLPPDSQTYKVDIPDGSSATVVAVWSGGYLYTVAVSVAVDGKPIHGYTELAEEYLSAVGA